MTPESRRYSAGALLLLGSMLYPLFYSGTADAADRATGIGIRGGTMGFGLDFSAAASNSVNLRLAYNYLSHADSIKDTDVVYDGTIRIGNVSGLLDWHPFASGFRITVGAISGGPEIDMVGKPTGGVYRIAGSTYSAADLGSLRGTISADNVLTPMIGIGYGNVTDSARRFTFLLDIGAAYGGRLAVDLGAECRVGLPPTLCMQIKSALQIEIQDLRSRVDAIRWYPVLNIGIGIRL